MKRLVTLSVALTICLTGCASISTVNIPEPDHLAANESKFNDKSAVYVFRGTGMTGAMWSFPVSLDETKIGSIRREQYLAFPTTSGAHWLTVTCPSLCEVPGYKINLNVSPGKSYYFMIEPDIAFGYNTTTMSSRLTQIDKVFADRLMETYEAAPVVVP